jgi:carbon monoxide dehydrogenase subunit G
MVSRATDMRLTNEITVDAPPDELFSFVSDIERVAACLPGARIDGTTGDEYRGSMRVKVGPITANYMGSLQLLELDAAARRAVLHARADEVTGQGQAEARIMTAIDEVAGGSRIRLDTDLQIRGRVAQFGRGAIEKIAQRLFAEFARNLETVVTSDGRPVSAHRPDPVAPPGRPAPPRAARDREAAPADAARMPAADAELDLAALLTRSAGGRLVPLIAAALIGFAYGYLLGKLRERGR